MPQASAAQREPSMEEILASIRRIIEDGETTPRRAERNDQPLPRAAGFADYANDEREPEIEAFRDEFAPELAAAVAAIDSEPAILLPHDGLLPDEIEAIAEGASTLTTVNLPPQAITDGAVNGRHDLSPNGAELRPSLDQAQRDFDESAAWRKAAIISERPSRQVAAAFDELSEAFAASRRRTFDEMAEEMMRPMLQDWLDNNLPHLVERLVREEIERIARGGSR